MAEEIAAPVSAVARVDSRLTRLAPHRLERLDEVRRYIQDIDFGPLKVKLAEPRDEGGQAWSRAKADFVEEQYKRWLFLRRKWENEALPPSLELDEFWHAHILDTQAYHRDCSYIFGGYFHHFPYFGMRGPSDAQALSDGFAGMHRRFLEEYGEPLYDFE
jgi:hypothetical protein